MKKIIILILIIVAGSLMAEKMQDFTLQDINGRQVKLSDHLQQGPIILDFWATWCQPCLKFLPELDKLLEKYDNLTVFAVSTDKPRKADEVKRLVKSFQFKFTTLLDTNGDLQRILNITSIPRTILLNAEGEIVYDHTGYVTGDEKKLEEEISKLLNPKVPDNSRDNDQQKMEENCE